MRLIVFTFLGSMLLMAACDNEPKTSSNNPDISSVPGINFPEIKDLTVQIIADSTNTAAYAQRAHAYAEHNMFEPAIADYNMAISLAPDDNRLYFELADLYVESVDSKLQLPDSKKAIELLTGYINKHPNDYKAYTELGMLYSYVAQYKESNTLMDQLLENDPYNPEAYYIKGLNALLKEDTARAIHAFERVIELKPENFSAHYEMGLIYANRGNPLAITYFDNALRSDSTEYEAWYAKGKFYQDKGMFTDAINMYRQMIRRDPTNEHTFFNLGYLYYEMDSLNKAKRNFDLAIKTAPAYADAHWAKGVVLEAMGELKAAMQSYKNALNLEPDHRNALESMEALRQKMALP